MENTAPNVKGLKCQGLHYVGAGPLHSGKRGDNKYITAVLCVIETQIVSDIIFFNHLKFMGHVCACTDP